MMPKNMLSIVALALGPLVASCHSGDDSDAVNPDAGTATSSDAGTVDAAPLCALDALPLVVDAVSSVPTRVHVPITSNGTSAVLLMDTGSNVTFMQEPLGTPDPQPDAGSFTIGCRNLSV
ncbi:MAG: hypothetical protein ABI461_16960, partial [Polyangiaceae bacterium]